MACPRCTRLPCPALRVPSRIRFDLWVARHARVRPRDVTASIAVAAHRPKALPSARPAPLPAGPIPRALRWRCGHCRSWSDSPAILAAFAA
jgi:hypothetical protein